MNIHHICIQTDTYHESIRFYQDLLGFKLMEETADFHSRAFNTWLDLNGFMIELQTGKAGELLRDSGTDQKGLVHFCLVAEDFDETLARILSTGYDSFKRKHGEISYSVNGGRLMKLFAPEGTIIEIRDKVEL